MENVLSRQWAYKGLLEYNDVTGSPGSSHDKKPSEGFRIWGTDQVAKDEDATKFQRDPIKIMVEEKLNILNSDTVNEQKKENILDAAETLENDAPKEKKEKEDE